MGSSKADLSLGRKTVLDCITDTLSTITPSIVINQNHEHNGEYPTIPDLYKDAGPLAGIHAVIAAREEEWFIISASDTPFIQQEVYEYLLGFRNEKREAIIPFFEGRRHPLSGIYHKRLWPVLDQLLGSGQRKVDHLLRSIHTFEVEDFYPFSNETLQKHFFNMNTPADYDSATKIIKNAEG